MAKPRTSQRVFHHLQWAIGQRLPSTRKVVLMSLAFRADDLGYCFPSIKRLEADTGLHRGTIIDAIRALESAGLVVAERKSGCVNRYLLTCSSEAAGGENHTGGESHTSTENHTGMENRTSTENRTDQYGKPHYHQCGKPYCEEAIEETNEEAKREAHSRTPSRSSSGKRSGTRLPDDFTVPADWLEDVISKHGWTRTTASTEAQNFVDYFTVGAGKNQTWVDWRRAWMNWCRKPYAGATAKPIQPKPDEPWMSGVIV